MLNLAANVSRFKKVIAHSMERNVKAKGQWRSSEAKTP